MLKLLRNIKVLDLTTVVLGPYATQILGDLGADVVKVEPLAGDVFRAVRPGRSAAMGAGFINCNRNKRSIALDLTAEAGRSAFYRMVEEADVVVHNMRPRSARKLGVDFDRLSAINPRLVYCYACGFGQDGPLADEPAYDDTIQAASGLAWLNCNAEGEPRFLRTIAADKVGGLHLAIAVLAALASADRAAGKSVQIEVPMFESMVSFLMLEQLGGRSFIPPLGGTGYDGLLSPYRKPFRSADGFIAILPYTAVHWARFLELVGRDDLADDPRVTDGALRSQSIDMLYAIIEQAAPGRTTADWIERLTELDVPCAEVRKLDDLFDDPHLREAGVFRATYHPAEGPVVSVRSPFRSPEKDEVEDLPAPLLGAHSRELLHAAGLSAAEIDALIASRAVATIGETKESEGAA